MIVAARRLALGFALLASLLPLLPVMAAQTQAAVGIVPFDSGTRAVREVAEALTGNGRSILESYPPGSKIFLGVVSLLPEDSRIAAIEWGIRRSFGDSPDHADNVSVDALAEWCIAQYPGNELYPIIVIGSPNGAVAHLAALLGAPLLTTSFGLAFHHGMPGSGANTRTSIDPDDVTAYRQTCLTVARRIAFGNANEGYELVCHFDPVHDRAMVQAAAFIRVKLRDLPDCYRSFVHERLASNGTLLLADCTYLWPQIALDERVFLQIGGLGAISPADYLERWPAGGPIEIRRESEWGCPEAFADAVRVYAEANNIDLVQVSRDHPAEYSLLAYAAYQVCAGVREDTILIDCFNHLNPRTNIIAGIPGLWLPFNTADGIVLIDRALRGRTFDTIYLTPLPSFVSSPDTASLDDWVRSLACQGTLEWIGIRPELFPADPLAPFRFADKMAELRAAAGQRIPLHLEIGQLEALLSTALCSQAEPAEEESGASLAHPDR